MEITTIRVGVKFSAQVPFASRQGKRTAPADAWKGVELAAEGTVAPDENWREAMTAIYHALCGDLRACWRNKQAGADDPLAAGQMQVEAALVDEQGTPWPVSGEETSAPAGALADGWGVGESQCHSS